MGVLNDDGLIYLWTKITNKIADALEGYLTKITADNTYAAKTEATQSASGLMSANDKKKLDGVSIGANAYTHPTGSGNKHIPSGGASGQILKWSADGTAAWGEDKDTIYETFGYAARYDGGTSGLVPAPESIGKPNGFKILSADHGWVNLTKEVNQTGSYVSLNINSQADARNDASNTTPPHMSFQIDAATSSKSGVMTSEMYTKLNALPTNDTLETTYAKKTDITNIYTYKGSIADASKLPTSGQKVGDTYNIEVESTYGGAGMNVAWNGTEWDPMGEKFSLTYMTNAEIDAICV